MLEKLFKLSENKTNVRTEVVAGFTTFMTMAYILAVNPIILSDAGMDKYAVMIATALASAAGSILMGILANYPFALAPGMGLNATFTYTMCIGMGLTWQQALLGVFIEGVIFILLSLTNVREAIFNAIPLTMKYAVSAGMGLFISFIGFQNAGIIANSDATLVSLTNFKADFNSTGLTALLAVMGVIIISVCLIRGIKGGILLGIVITWVVGIILELTGIYQPVTSCIPSFDGFHFTSIGITFGQCFNVDLSNVDMVNYAAAIFALLFVDVFDTLGGLIGISSNADMLDENGRLPRIKGALLVDALATTIGAIFGTSTTTTYAESATGVEEGGRTGLTSIVTGLLFIAAVFFSPIFTAIPYFATAPALIIAGVYMMGSVLKINFNDFTDGIPAFLCIAIMPFSYSISDGIFISFICYTVINVLAGKAREKHISALMYVLTILFILKYVLF